MATPVCAPPDRPTALRAIVCLDGSRVASAALGPAIEVASSRNESVMVVVVGGNDRAVRKRVLAQLEAAGVESVPPVSVTSRADMVSYLLGAAHQGATPVLSAFSSSGTPGQLYGVLGELIRSDVPRLLAIGPHISPTTPLVGGPIIVSVDNVRRVDPLIDATAAYLDTATTKLIVAHVVAPSERGASYATARNAAKFEARFDVPVDVATIADDSVSQAIATLARDELASLIIARSWHRAMLSSGSAQSGSLSIVVEAPCPVLIVN